MLVLHLLIKEDMYGYQINNALNKKGTGKYRIFEGSLYLVLHRLIDSDYISCYTELVGKRRKRKYYHIEKKGYEYYCTLVKEYDEISNAINKILDREVMADEKNQKS